MVPRPGHGAGQRRGHQRGPIRPRQPSGLPPPHEAVDDAHHGVRRPAAGRPRPGGLVRERQDHAAQLDRAQRGCLHQLRRRSRPRWFRPSHRGVHHPARHDLRHHGHAVGPRASPGRQTRRRRVAVGDRSALDRWCSHASRGAQCLPGPGSSDDRPAAPDRTRQNGRVAGRELPRAHDRRASTRVRRRLCADRLRHRRGHVGAGRGPARLGLLREVRPADHAHRGAAARLRRRGLRRPRTGRQQRLPQRHGQGRRHRGHLRLAGRPRLRPPHGHLQAARLAVQPAALLGRANSDRVRRDGPAAGGAREPIARRAARAHRLGSPGARRVVGSRAAARPRHTVGHRHL